DRVRLAEANPDGETLRTTVAGAEHEVPDAVQDRAAAIHLERLDDMGVMSDDGVGPAVHREPSLGSDVLRRLALIGNAPVGSHDDAIDARGESADIAPERAPRIDRDARRVRSRGAASMPVVAEKAEPVASHLPDNGCMRRRLIDAAAE